MPFHAHVELLHSFIAHRDAIADRIQGVLNAQRRPVDYLQDRALLFQQVEDGVFDIAAAAGSRSPLRGQLERAHRAGGFTPRNLPGLHNGLIDPAEMMIRAFHMWRQTRWPGRSGRIHYAHTLFHLYLIRCLALLSMRLWDDEPATAPDRLTQIQDVLDRLWRTAPPDQPVFVRDARWLIPLAQSPATDELGPYFDVTCHIAETLSETDRLAIHKANVKMAGGHLRSQCRYYSARKAVPLDEPGVVVNTRSSNALDFALLIQDLVPLFAAYEKACDGGDVRVRLDLADAICQGISPDPELFLNRIELLGAYSTIEHLFVAIDRDGQPAYTPAGRRHVQFLEEYETRVGRVATPLAEDCRHFRPTAGAYSPYGALYGFATDLIEHMALKATQPEAATPFGLEDVFSGGDAASGKLAWVAGWRKLPHLRPEVIEQFDYPQQFAQDVFTRIEQALARRVAPATARPEVAIGRLFLGPADSRADGTAPPFDDLPIQYIKSSDMEMVAAQRAERYDELQLLSDRRESRCLVSYRTPGGWVAITKALLTEILGEGRDVKVVGLPPSAAATVKLLGRTLVVISDL